MVSVPEANATLTIEPASRSAWVTVRLAVQVSEAVGARSPSGNVTAAQKEWRDPLLSALMVTLLTLVTS